jgi:CubicO group peptidase (beta-lactamase class C family)
MKILVCGGRDYENVSAVRHALTALHVKNPISLIIEGAALGADRLAREWAEISGVPVQTFEAEWKRYGRRAGPLRNKRMLDEGRPDGVVAFPGGAGTANMIDLANACRVKVWRPFG